MKILLIRAKENPVLRDIPHQLSIFQQPVVLVCDESGRNDGKAVNRIINDHIDVCGDFFLCGHDGKSLSDFPLILLDKYISLFSLPPVYTL